MSPDELAFLQRVNARASRLTPALAIAIIAAFKMLSENMDNPALAEMIESGDVEGAIREALSDAAFAIAFTNVRDILRTSTADAVRYFAADIPGSRIGGQLVIGFDMLNPDVITALRTMESRQLDSLATDIRDTFRAFIENGLRDGEGVAAIARDVRGIVGLAPNQLQEALNFRAKLADGDFAGALGYELRDRRFDPTLRALQQSGKQLTPAQLDAMNAAYLRKKIAFNATVNARTAATNALRLGQRISWQDAIDKGIIDVDQLTKTWRGVMDSRERLAHVVMEGQKVGFDDRFSNGQLIPGESDYNCRCWPVYRITARAA